MRISSYLGDECHEASILIITVDGNPNSMHLGRESGLAWWIDPKTRKRPHSLHRQRHCRGETGFEIDDHHL